MTLKSWSLDIDSNSMRQFEIWFSHSELFLIFYLLSYLLGYDLVHEDKYCKGSYLKRGYASLYECSKLCDEKNTNYFIYISDSTSLFATGGTCECQPGIEDGTCPLANDADYNLYAFKKYSKGVCSSILSFLWKSQIEIQFLILVNSGIVIKCNANVHSCEDCVTSNLTNPD